ncbi:hypothetical protein CA267_016005 [Alteromonas pelagimontana]|uniref:Uncharacterized protein n=1 Tax=Alteromonas pelagimontana TaxID=1858656 RepID=A0A6M4MJ63_9ALTE|nr:hypothetical protein [Alteromonas pelagimontana]QJR82146.1 hypothetical protein CA267_016005 [Alteromonas pelagimontana]
MTLMNITDIDTFKPSSAISDDEDILILYKEGKESICYVRNYLMQQEFLIISSGLVMELPEYYRPMTNIFVRVHFHVIRKFRLRIQEYVIKSNQLLHFYRFFDASIAEFFDSL